MGKGFKHGGSGVPLNFKIVGGTAEPSSPRENTLWVNTGTSISGWVMSPMQPVGIEGMVWIKTAAEGNGQVNILKKNAIELYPAEAWQYIDGVWEKKSGQTYTNGQWVDWIKYQYLSLSQDKWLAQRAHGNGGAVSSNNGVLYLKTAERYTPGGISYTSGFTATYQEALDLSNFDTMEVEMKLSKTGLKEVRLSILDIADAQYANTLAQYTIDQKQEKTVYSLDISGLSSGYPSIFMYDNTELTTATITMIRLKG